MNVILAIETASHTASLALWRGGSVLREWSYAAGRSSEAKLIAALGEALATEAPGLIVAGTGPGSYTSVRAAAAAALGISLARGLRLIGLPSLEALPVPPACHVVGDARRGHFFLATLAEGRLAADPALMERQALEAQLAASRLPAFTMDAVPPLPGLPCVVPHAARLAGRAAALSEPVLAQLAAAAPQPLYLRPPYITQAKPRGSRA